MSERLAILTAGLLDVSNAKTAHGVIRYGAREVVAVIDERFAGRSVTDVVPFCRRPVPVVATLAEAVERGATALLIGVAPTGGRLEPAWRALVLDAVRAGLDVEAGLHTLLADDAEIAAAAGEHGVRLRDLRVAPPDLGVPLREPRRAGLRVVHSVGSDVALGKKVATLELDRAARERGLSSAYVPTGQTGVAIAGWGIAVDHVIADYVAGAAERLVLTAAERADLLFVEGQGSLVHPAYSGVTLGLLHGSAPDALVLAHRAGATHVHGYADVPIPPLAELVELYDRALRPVVPHGRVACVSVNTGALAGDADARAACAAIEDECGLPADDPVRFGAGRLLDAVLAALPR